MRLAIISDIHDNRLYLEKCLAYCAIHNLEAILCTGDVVSNETVARLDDFAMPVYLIRGNADYFDDGIFKKLDFVHYLGRTGEVTLVGKKIGLCHEPFYIKELLPNHYDIIFHGHTHKPWIKKQEGTLIVNPGTLSGQPAPSTFAVWDTEKAEPDLIITDTI